MKVGWILYLVISFTHAQSHHIVKPRPRRLVIPPFYETLPLSPEECRWRNDKRFNFYQALLDRIDGIQPPRPLLRAQTWPPSIKEIHGVEKVLE